MPHYTIEEIDVPETQPISVEDVKLHGKVNTAKEDPLVSGRWIPAARRRAERRTSRRLITTRLKQWMDVFPCEAIELTWAPVSSIVEISYIDGDGVTQTDADPENSGTWQIDRISEPTRIKPAYGESWPTIRSVFNAVSVMFDCGYGSLGDDVPEDLRLGMLQYVVHWTQHRETRLVGTIQSLIPMMGDELVDPFAWRHLA